MIAYPLLRDRISRNLHKGTRMAELLTISLANVDSNPLRRLDAYPYSPPKIEALRQSVRDVGLWEGVIGRRHGNHVQIAFGHPRIEAARQELGNEAKISLILRDLDDKQMLQFMGRENLEDYNADFLVMLETWESAVNYLRDHDHENIDPLDIARVIGWVRKEKDNSFRCAPVALACDHALTLLNGKYIKHDDLI